jgi:hypothetical protein
VKTKKKYNKFTVPKTQGQGAGELQVKTIANLQFDRDL